MNKFSLTCACGDVMNVEAATREEAVTKLQGTMTQDAITAHFTAKHPGQPAMAVADVHAMIADKLAAVTA